MDLNTFRDACYDASKKRGWWDMPYVGDLPHKAAIKIALIHSELSEALEGVRNLTKRDEHLPHRLTVEVELVDALIRIFDLAGALGVDLQGTYNEKMAYNTYRADHNPENRNRPDGKRF